MNRNTNLALAATIGIALLSASPSLATTCTGLDPSVAAFVVDYYKPNPIPPNDFRCNGTKECKLSGWLYLPPTPKEGGGLPAIVYNHGHDQERGEPCAIAQYFTSRGYLVFAPLRRGHTDIEAGIINTGLYSDYYVASKPAALRNAATVEYLQFQVSEVAEAIRYLTTNLIADPKRIAILGHSYGGTLTVFSAASPLLNPTPKAAIDISGAVLDWDDNPSFMPAMVMSVVNRKMPIFFLQSRNEVSHEPTVTLSNAAATTGNTLFLAGFFPAVLPDANECPTAITDLCSGPGKLINKEVHGRFITRTEHVKDWGPTAQDFLRLYGVK